MALASAAGSLCLGSDGASLPATGPGTAGIPPLSLPGGTALNSPPLESDPSSLPREGRIAITVGRVLDRLVPALPWADAAQVALAAETAAATALRLALPAAALVVGAAAAAPRRPRAPIIESAESVAAATALRVATAALAAEAAAATALRLTASADALALEAAVATAQRLAAAALATEAAAAVALALAASVLNKEADAAAALRLTAAALAAEAAAAQALRLAAAVVPIPLDRPATVGVAPPLPLWSQATGRAVMILFLVLGAALAAVSIRSEGPKVAIVLNFFGARLMGRASFAAPCMA